MKNLSILTQKVLSFNEPDCEKWDQWLERKELNPVSACEEMEMFVDIMKQAKQNKEKVIVAGDYDSDGIMATTIMVDGLKRFGLEVGFYIPDRIKEGYGLNCHTVELAYKKGYTILITVDNGVKAFDALERAAQLGITTIVTDHHTIDEYIDCDCLVHPSVMEDCFSTLCGSGVAYECMRALHCDTDYHLMCACVASIGDVMAVKKETRTIIQKGIELLNTTREPHFMALVNDRVLNETSISFQIVPKLNALGRLSHLANVNNAVRYFLSEGAMPSFARQIISINNQRKELSSQILNDVTHRIDPSKDILFVLDESYPEGIVGLVAGSLCAQYNKPSIVATSREGITKGSMRAPEGFNCMDFLTPFELFETFGGHAQAAGLSFLDENLEDFENYIETNIKEYEWTPVPKENLVITPQELSVSQVQSLDVLRPFGNGFECPEFEIIHPEIKSAVDISSGKHRKYILSNGIQCMNFNQSQEDKRSQKKIYSFVGSVGLNYYQQRVSVNFIINKINYENDTF